MILQIQISFPQGFE